MSTSTSCFSAKILTIFFTLDTTCPAEFTPSKHTLYFLLKELRSSSMAMRMALLSYGVEAESLSQRSSKTLHAASKMEILLKMPS